jgi:uncharacterized protein
MKKFLNAGKFYGADVVIAAGDLTGKAMVPVVERRSGRYEALVAGRRQSSSPEEVGRLERAIRMNGFYPFRCDEQTYDRLADDEEFRDTVFTAAMADGLRDWVKLADERLGGADISCLVMPGNDDGPFFEEIVAESSVLTNHDGRVVDVEGLQILGFGPSNPTPWDTYREVPESEIERSLKELESLIDPDRPLILNTHVPPFGSGLDEAPKLRDDLSFDRQGGEVQMVPVGSHAVRDFIERRQPLLSLHGHIHESRGIVQIGKTVAVNPGSEYTNATLRGAVITVQDDRVVSSQLVAG